MKRLWILLFAILLLLPAGCKDAEPDASRVAVGTFRPVVGQATPVAIADLAASPARYEGEFIQVTGQYRGRPQIVCDRQPRRAPAGWALSDGTNTIAAGGFDAVVRPALPAGLTVAAQGTWRFWRGEVGCGKKTTTESIWYLAVREILEPDPIARVTLTPAGGVLPSATPAAVAGQPSPTAFATPTLAVATPAPPPSPPATTQEPPPIGPPEVLTATATLPATTDATASTIAAAETTASATPTADTSATAGPSPTGTPSPTPSATLPGGVTPTPSTTPIPTATPEEPIIVDQEEIIYQALVRETLAAQEAHRWTIEITAGDVVTVSLVADTTMDMAFEVVDPDGTVVVKQDDVPAGEVERREALTLDGDGTYQIIVWEKSRKAGDYAMMVLNNSSASYYEFIFPGVITYGTPRTFQMRAKNDHFVHFAGEEGDVINLEIDPNDSADLFFDLFGPEAEQLTDSVDEGGQGDVEQLLNFTLPATGLYSIYIAELNFEEANYTISVDKNQ